MAEYQGFWSYVRADDKAERGRIVQLAEDLSEQFEMLTGEEIALFLDREDIAWGDNWRAKIDAGLASVAFFIAVLTPRYFLSPECRRELQLFARKADDLGVKDLVLPILYANVADMQNEKPEDDLVALVKTFQWEDWRELRLEDVNSSKYRRAVARLAERLVRANRRAEELAVEESTAMRDQTITADEDDSPGVLDRLASAEKALPEWNRTVSEITAEIQNIGKAMQDAARQVERGDAQGKGFQARAKAAQVLAARLRTPADRILALGREFAAHVHDVDGGFRTIIELAPAEVERLPEHRQDFCDFFQTVISLAQATASGLDSSEEMINHLAPLEAASRDLRPVVRRLRQGLTSMVEARNVTDEWVTLIDSSGLGCREALRSDE